MTSPQKPRMLYGMRGFRSLASLALIGTVIAAGMPLSLRAQQDGGIKQEVDGLDQQIKDKRARVNELGSMVGKYRQRIAEQEKAQTSLENEVLILDNRITAKQLTIEQIKTELEVLQLEIASLEDKAKAQGDRYERQRVFAAALVRRIDEADRVSPIELLLSKRNLSTFFDRVSELKAVEEDLGRAMANVKALKRSLEENRTQQDEKRKILESQRKQLAKEELGLEAERNFKLSLAQETQNKQSEYERVLYELQQQQQGTAEDIAALEEKLKDKLDSIDQSLARGDILLNWPVDPSRGITATFHDPTYPFRNMFEHPGTDVRASVGTDVRSAAGGYVAWNKTGRMYGNYMMVVHPGNIATVYAHLTKFLAKPDSYVDRGEVIAKSGGRPGDPGAGLSTGPHLHFEVRQNGIPVDPQNFLPDVD